MTPESVKPWWGAKSDPASVIAFGIRLEGGGAHQSKTMMFDELGRVVI